MSTAASPPAFEAAAPLRLIAMGVGGVGKSTVASALADRLHLACVDGDDLHPPTNVARMRSGVLLDDADRWPWLVFVSSALRSSAGLAVACSAPKRADRDRVRAEAAVGPRFTVLDAAPTDLEARLRGRPGHVMPVTLMDSRCAALERPASDERDGLTVSAGRPVQTLVDDIVSRLPPPPHPGEPRHG